MNKRESWKTWLPLLGLLVLFGLVSAVWPALANAFALPTFGGGSSTSVPVEVEPVHLEALKMTLSNSSLPAPIASAVASAAEALPDTISPLVALLVVTAVTIGLVVGAGGGLAFAIRLISRVRDNTVETEAFTQHQTALEQKTKAQIDQLRDGRTTDPVPEHKMPRWSVISNTLITLMFVGFGTILIVRNFFPEGTTEVNHQIVPVTGPVFAVLALITLIILGIRLRPQKVEAVAQTDFGKIPWDFIAVLITGLIMLGLGIGFMAYINATPG